jgi:hypothetical protein
VRLKILAIIPILNMLLSTKNCISKTLSLDGFLCIKSHELGTSMAEKFLLSFGHENPLCVLVNQPYWWDDMVVHAS